MTGSQDLVWLHPSSSIRYEWLKSEENYENDNQSNKQAHEVGGGTVVVGHISKITRCKTDKLLSSIEGNMQVKYFEANETINIQKSKIRNLIWPIKANDHN